MHSGGNAAPAFPHASQQPARPPYTGVSPSGHLGDFLNQHRNLPEPEQERMLRASPSFRRLPPADQQHVIEQLHQIRSMPEEQRQRRLAWNEALEHMSPQGRLRIYDSLRRKSALPPERQELIRRAWHDRSALPLDQRTMELNSERYRGIFTPEERGILVDFLSVVPYYSQPPH